MRFSSFAELKIGALMAVFLIIIGWGLSSLITGIRFFLLNVPGRLDILYSPPIARSFFSEMLYLPTGAAILVLVTDYAATGKVLKRHRIEFVIAVAFGSLLRVSRVLYDFVGWLSRGVTFDRLALWASWPESISDSIINGSMMIILAALTLHIAYRVLTGKSIVTGWTLSFVAAYFLWFAMEIMPISITSNPPFLQLWPLDELAYSTNLVAYAATGVFLLVLALKMRHNKVLNVSAPLYLRLIMFGFGVVGILYNIDWNLTNRGVMSWDQPWVIFVGVATRAAIVYLAIRPPRFTIGSTNDKVGEVMAPNLVTE